MEQTHISVENDKQRVTVYVVHPIPVPINGKAEYKPVSNGVRFTLADGTEIGIPTSNIVCIVQEVKNAVHTS